MQSEEQIIDLFFQATEVKQDGEWKKAYKMFEQFIEQSKYLEKTVLNLNCISEAFYELGLYKSAIQPAQQALQNERQFQSLYILGLIYYETGQFNYSIDYYVQALKLKQDRDSTITILNHLGLSLLKMQKYKEANKKFQKALEIDPEYYSPLNNIGLILIQTRQYKEAINFFNKLLLKIPNDQLFLANIGVSLIYLKKYDQAAEYLQKSLQIQPDHDMVQYCYGFLLNRQLKYLECIKVFEEQTYTNETQNFQFIAEVGYSYLMINEQKQAKRYFTLSEKYFSSSKQIYDLFYYQSLYHIKNKDVNLSKKNMKKYLQMINENQFEDSDIFNQEWSAFV